MDIFYEIQDLMDAIMRTMDDGSRYDDYEPEFAAIENLMEGLDENHPVSVAFHEMYKSLYESKGSLECSYYELLDFQKTVDVALSVVFATPFELEQGQ